MYRVEFTAAAQKDILSIPGFVRNRMEIAVEQLQVNPRPEGSKKLKGRENTYRIRLGDYRILYSIEDRSKMLTVFRIRHRKEVYR